MKERNPFMEILIFILVLVIVGFILYKIGA